MILIPYISGFNDVFYGVITVLIAIGVFLHGQRNGVLAWPWAVGIIIFGPLLLLFYIVFVAIQYRSEPIWEEKEDSPYKYDLRGYPDKWKKRKEPPKPPEDEFDGYNMPPE